jgi:hypothetical protein
LKPRGCPNSLSDPLDRFVASQGVLRIPERGCAPRRDDEVSGFAIDGFDPKL